MEGQSLALSSIRRSCCCAECLLCGALAAATVEHKLEWSLSICLLYAASTTVLTLLVILCTAPRVKSLFLLDLGCCVCGLDYVC